VFVLFSAIFADFSAKLAVTDFFWRKKEELLTAKNAKGSR
jgi:hypothetical protein